MGVLDDMTKGINDRKVAAAGPRLTPVGTEASSTKPSLTGQLPDVPEVFLTNEALRDIAKDLRRQATVLVDVANGLDTHTGMATVETEDNTAAVVKADEKAADEKAAERKAQPKSTEEFTEHLATIAAEAQASVFTSADAPAEEPAAPTTTADGWVCPDHGDVTITQLTSRKGRAYRSCTTPGCKQFEKE